MTTPTFNSILDLRIKSAWKRYSLYYLKYHRVIKENELGFYMKNKTKILQRENEINELITRKIIQKH